MPRFGIEDLCIHGVDRIVAVAHTESGSPSLRLSVLNDKGESVDIPLFFDVSARAYLKDLAAVINREADDHGRLTTDERADLLDEDPVPLSRQMQSPAHVPPELREGSRDPRRFALVKSGPSMRSIP